MNNRSLSIAIPTYNRWEILAENIISMIPELIQFEVSVFVSDDSPNNETELAVEDLRKNYPAIFYRRNSPSLGHDQNCVSTLSWPDTDYVWYLGDSMVIASGGIAAAIEAIRAAPACVFVNCNAFAIDAETGVLPSLRGFLPKAAWYLTLSGATVYSRRVIDWMQKNLREKWFPNFQQLGIVLAYAAALEDSAYWIRQVTIVANRKKKSYWSSNVLDVFGRDWANLILAFPDLFGGDNLSAVLRSHSKYHGLYGLANIMNFRALGGISREKYASNRVYLGRTSHLGLWPFRIILLIPVPVAKAIKKLCQLLRK